MVTEFNSIQQDKAEYVRDLLAQIEPQWHAEFERFVETGEADEGFLTYLDQSEAAQTAVEGAFKHQAARFEKLAEELKRRQGVTGPEPAKISALSSTTATKVAAVIEGALQASSTQRAQVVARTTAALAASMPAEDAEVVEQVAESLKNRLAEVAQVGP